MHATALLALLALVASPALAKTADEWVTESRAATSPEQYLVVRPRPP